MANPLDSLAAAAKQTIQTTVEWGFSDSGRRRASDKTDPTFHAYPLDTLRRAALASDFETLFRNADDFPYVTPDKTLKRVIAVLSGNLYPTGSKMTSADDAVNALLQDILRQTRFSLRAENIVNESALMGYCGLRSVWRPDVGRWLLEIKPKEYLVIETETGLPDQVTAIGLEWPTERVDERGRKSTWWRKERWTDAVYEVYADKRQTGPDKPTWKPDDLLTSEPNTYGEIPITLVPHYFDEYGHGAGIVAEPEILTVKALIRLWHKRHYAHLKYCDPNPVRTNHAKPGEPVDMGIGRVIDVQAAQPDTPADFKLLEFAGTPDSLNDEFYALTKTLYAAAGLKAPPPDETFKAGVETAGVALRLQGKEDADTIQTLRDNGYSMVFRHFEKLLRMGARLGLPEYGVINPEDPETYSITAKYPDFFPPTDADIALKIANMKAAELPPDLMGPMIATLFGIDDQAHIDAITTRLEEKEAQQAEMMTRYQTGGGFNAGGA